jgi:hypothetical protein
MYGLDIPDASLIKQLEMKIAQFISDHGFFDPTQAPVKEPEVG